MRGIPAKLVVIVAVSVLAGCGSRTTAPESIASSHYAGLPSGVSPSRAPYQLPIGSGVLGTWRGTRLELTVWGSGSCPPTPVRLVPRPPDAVEVTFSNAFGHAACTSDLSATTWVLDLPSTVGTSGTVLVHVRGGGVPRTDLTVRRAG